MSLTKRRVGFFAPPETKLDPGSRILLERLTEKEDFAKIQGKALDNPLYYLDSGTENKQGLIEETLHALALVYAFFMHDIAFIDIYMTSIRDASTSEIFTRIRKGFRVTYDIPHKVNISQHKSQMSNIINSSFMWLDERIKEILGGKNIRKEVFNKAIYEEI